MAFYKRRISVVFRKKRNHLLGAAQLHVKLKRDIGKILQLA